MRRRTAVGLLRLSNRPLWREFSRSSAVQWYGADALADNHERQLTDLLAHATRHVPLYRQWAKERGLTPTDITAQMLAEFPTTDKTQIMSRRDSHVAEDAKPTDRIASHTGGSSGIIFHFEYDRRTKDARRAGDLLGRTWTGWRPGEVVAYVWGHTGDVSAAAGLKARVADKLMHRRIVLNAFDMDAQVIESYVSRLQSIQPNLIIGYASSLAFIAEYMARKGHRGIRPRGIISSAETLGPEKRATISEYFGCPVYDRYGSREFANIAQQCERGAGLHVFHDRLHVEVLRPGGVSCEPGELGEIVVTDLQNRVMPFIRYRTGDLAVPGTAPCACGRHLPVLDSVHGRLSEIIVGPNGKYYACPGPTWLGSDIPGIGQLQLIQPELSSIEVRIVPGAEWTAESKLRVESRMRQLLGDVQVRVTLVDRIAPAASGKHQIVISSVSPFVPRT